MKKGRIYTVHYGNNIQVTMNFIKSIEKFLREEIDLVVINNSSNDINITSKNIKIVNTNKNLGYFGGIKYGMQEYPPSSKDFIIICNNDVEITHPDFFSILDKKLDKYDIIGPSIKTSDNVEQNPHLNKRPSKLRKAYYKLYFSSFVIALFLNFIVKNKKKKISNNLITCDTNVFSIHGAFIILKSSFFEGGGYIDDGYFLYGEENSISAQAYNLKLKTAFVPDLKVFHLESISTGKIFSKKKYYFQKNASQYIHKKYPSIF